MIGDALRIYMLSKNHWAWGWMLQSRVVNKCLKMY